MHGIYRGFRKLKSYILKSEASVRLCPLRSQRALTLYTSDRLRCCDRYIRRHRLLAVKPLSPREHAGRRVGKGGTLGSVQTERHPIPVLLGAE